MYCATFEEKPNEKDINSQRILIDKINYFVMLALLCETVQAE